MYWMIEINTVKKKEISSIGRAFDTRSRAFSTNIGGQVFNSLISLDLLIVSKPIGINLSLIGKGNRF